MAGRGYDPAGGGRQAGRRLGLPAGCLLAVGLLLGLAAGGCGEQGDEGRREPAIVRVAVWKPNNPQAWEEALARFHREHPGMRVELEIGPNSSTQLHDLITQKLRNRDTSLDAFLMDVVWPAEFAAAGWALPLDDWFTPVEQAAFFPGCVAAVTYDGQIYGFPFNTDGGLLYYRRDLLARHGLDPPTTWPQLVEQVAAILAAEEDPALQGYSGQFRQYEGLVCNMLEFVESHGGDLLAPDAAPAVAAVRFVRDSIVGSAAPRGVLTYEEQESLDLFKSGGTIFLRSWPYAWAILNDPAQSKVVDRVGIARLPRFSGGEHVATLGGWSIGVHRHSRHPEAAVAFAQYMTSQEMQAHFAIASGKAPARRALYDDPDVLQANPHFADLRVVFESATPRPRSPIYPRLSHILQRYFHAAISDPASEIEALARRAAERLAAEQAALGAAGGAGARD